MLTPNKTTRALALILGLLALPATAQDSVELSFEDARILGAQAVTTGNPSVALQLADGLLQADPRDAVALRIRAAALLQLGDATAARRAAASAFRLAPDAAGKYEAARIAALAAANEDRYTLSGWWLRLALTQAPTEADAAQTRQDARQIARLNPWDTRVRLSFAPSDNVNGGATDSTYLINGEGLEFIGLEFVYNAPALGRALSGWRGTLDINTSYTLAQTQTTQHAIEAGIYSQTIRLSDAAIAQLAEDDITVPGDYFDYDRLDLGYSYNRVTQLGLIGFDAGVFTTWQGGARTSNGLSLDFGLTHRIDPRNTLIARIGTERRWSTTDDTRLSLRTTATLRYSHRFETAGSLGLGLTYTDFASASVEGHYGRWQISTDYTFADPIGPAYVSLQAGLSLTDYPTYLDFANVEGVATPILTEIPGGRQEDRVFARVTAAFPTYDFAGFYPVVTFDAVRTSSNVGRFDSHGSAIDLTFQSSF